MRRKLSRSLCVVVVFALFLLMALGSGSSANKETKKIVAAEDTEASDSTKISESTKLHESAKSPETVISSDPVENVPFTIEPSVLVDQDGLKISTTGITDDDFWGTGIKLLIENNTANNITVSCNALIVNNYMISGYLYSNVSADKKSNEVLYLSSDELTAAGISSVGQIDIYFHVSNSDNYDAILDTDCISIQTSLYADMEIKAMDDGKELLNQDGIRIVGKYVDEDSIWGTAVLLFIENTSGQNITISCDNMSINGYMVTPIFYSTVYDGKMAIDEIAIVAADLEENNITSVDEIELVFHVTNADSYHTLFDSEIITFAAQ